MKISETASNEKLSSIWEQLPQPMRAPNGSSRILFVDDDTLVRAMASAMLESQGWQVFQACNGEEATQLFTFCSTQRMPVAVVIMDIILPGGMNGIDTMQKLRALDPEVRIIASSGYFEVDGRAQCQSIGFSDVLPKSYSPEQLSSTLLRCQSNYSDDGLALD